MTKTHTPERAALSINLLVFRNFYRHETSFIFFMASTISSPNCPSIYLVPNCAEGGVDGSGEKHSPYKLEKQWEYLHLRQSSKMVFFLEKSLDLTVQFNIPMMDPFEMYI